MMNRKFDAANLFVSASNMRSRFQSRKAAMLTMMVTVMYSTEDSAIASVCSIPCPPKPLTHSSKVAMKRSKQMIFSLSCTKRNLQYGVNFRSSNWFSPNTSARAAQSSTFPRRPLWGSVPNRSQSPVTPVPLVTLSSSSRVCSSMRVQSSKRVGHELPEASGMTFAAGIVLEVATAKQAAECPSPPDSKLRKAPGKLLHT
mmetsp:Transcript_15467/g.54197  ORF Transcript_15467/g.54197 Transcript_15467/m.54197 type:complete len:200 (+) Transcript_15467:496-1095(+)